MVKLIAISFLIMSSAFAQVSLKGDPQLKFTGYKFTNKEGVSGTFKKITWSVPKKSKTVEELVKGMKARVDAYSIDAGKKARNVNITNGLFKNWGGQFIEAQVVEVDKATGFVKMKFSVGKKSHETYFQYHQSGKKIQLTGSVDLLQMGMHEAFKKLSNICRALHRGKDKVAKTWSVVDLEVNAELK